MAKAPEKTEGDAPAQGSKKKLIIIIAVVVVLLVGAIAGFLIIKKSHPPADEEEADGGASHKSAKAKKKPEAAPVIVKLDQFTVKLQPDEEARADHYMQATLELEVLDNAAAERVKVFISKIRAKVLLMLMGKTPAEMSTPQGIEKLTNDIRTEINGILDGAPATPAATATAASTKPNPDDSVQAVYLTQFLVQ